MEYTLVGNFQASQIWVCHRHTIFHSNRWILIHNDAKIQFVVYITLKTCLTYSVLVNPKLQFIRNGKRFTLTYYIFKCTEIVIENISVRKHNNTTLPSNVGAVQWCFRVFCISSCEIWFNKNFNYPNLFWSHQNRIINVTVYLYKGWRPINIL